MAREGGMGKENQRIQLKPKEQVEARLWRALYDLIRHFRLHSSPGKRRVREFLSKQVTASALCFLKEWPGRKMFAHVPCQASPRPPSSGSWAAFRASRWQMRRSLGRCDGLEQESLPWAKAPEIIHPA